jgi:hypothetical protein
MATNHCHRLDRLEQTYALSRRPERWHRVIGEEEAELDERVAELIARGDARPTDGFIRRLIVLP